MTRDEAIKVWLRNFVIVLTREEAAAQNIDCLVELGLLKLDEPKTTEQKIKDAFTKRGWSWLNEADFINDLAAEGLEIVDAKFRNTLNFRDGQKR